MGQVVLPQAAQVEELAAKVKMLEEKLQKVVGTPEAPTELTVHCRRPQSVKRQRLKLG